MLKPARLTLFFFLNIYFAKWLSVIDIHFPVQQFTAGCKCRHFAYTSEIVWWWWNWRLISTMANGTTPFQDCKCHKFPLAFSIGLSTFKVNFSIKHDLARSCFQLWPIIGDEDDKFSKFCNPQSRLWAIIENMILSDYVLYYIPQYLEILWKLLNILEFIRKEVAASLISVAAPAYLIFVIFFTLVKFLTNKIYTEKCQFFALNL